MKDYYKSIVQLKEYGLDFKWDMPFKTSETSISRSTGFFIDDKGHILTCAHCVSNMN